MKTLDTGIMEADTVIKYFEAVGKVNKENLLNDSLEATARRQEIRNGLTAVERQLFDEDVNPRLAKFVRDKFWRRVNNVAKWITWSIAIGIAVATAVMLVSACVLYTNLKAQDIENGGSGEYSSVSIW